MSGGSDNNKFNSTKRQYCAKCNLLTIIHKKTKLKNGTIIKYKNSSSETNKQVKSTIWDSELIGEIMRPLTPK